MVFSYPLYSPPPGDIDFNQFDWFDQYVVYRKKFPPRVSFPSQDVWTGQPSTSWRSLEEQYHLVLLSGLIYGFPFISPFQPQPSGALNVKITNQLLLLDLLWFAAQNHPSTGPETDIGALIHGFYHGLRLKTAPGGLLNTLLDQRVPLSVHWFEWRKKGVNTHLFWDWYLFHDYLDAHSTGPLTPAYFDHLKARLKDLQATTMSMIAAAIHSDVKVKHREKILDHYFLASSRIFNHEEISGFRRMFHEGITLNQITLPEQHPLAVHYWLDVLLLTMSTDQEFNLLEYDFTAQLMQRLGLKDEDLLQSQLVLGSFIYRFGRKIPFLNSRKISLVLLSRAVSENFRNMRYATQAEYHETVQMATTFGKLLQHQLGVGQSSKMPTEEELKAALAQLKDVPKFLPFFTVFFMPVPGITESYILLAYTIERLTGNTIRLLPSNFSKMIKSQKKK